MNYPQWKKSDWSETRFGVTMKDEYIGLEQPKDPAVLSWVARENALTDQFFSTLPGYAKKKEQLQARPFLRQLYRRHGNAGGLLGNPGQRGRHAYAGRFGQGI